MLFLYLSGLQNAFPEYQNNLLRNQSVCVQAPLLSCVLLFATSWTGARQAPLSMEFSRQEYWGGLPFPPPGDLPDTGIEFESLASPALAGGFLTNEPPGKPYINTVQ